MALAAAVMSKSPITIFALRMVCYLLKTSIKDPNSGEKAYSPCSGELFACLPPQAIGTTSNDYDFVLGIREMRS
jgi:hypothetical protein